MVCVPVRLIIPSLKLGDYLSAQAHKPCSISHLFYLTYPYPSYHRVGMSRCRVWNDSGRVGYGVAAYPEQIQCHTLPYMNPYNKLAVGWVRVRTGQDRATQGRVLVGVVFGMRTL